MTPPTDCILAIQDPYMQQIINGTKNHEFRKYLLESSISRIWFYRTAPHSAITHVCEIQPARTRKPGDAPLDQDGLGNAEFNGRHPDWYGYDFANKILRVWELRESIALSALRAKHGFESAPRGLVYLPKSISDEVAWENQIGVRNNFDTTNNPTSCGQ